MRSTPAIARAAMLACVLACLPARAVDLIDLHDLQNGGLRAALMRDPVPVYLADSLSGYRLGYYIDYHIDYRIDYPGDYLPGADPGDERDGIPAEISPGVPPPAASWPATVMLEAAPAPIPVPEPVSVLMLACGLLLIMPGAWAARSSRLGDNESLLQRRLP